MMRLYMNSKKGKIFTNYYFLSFVLGALAYYMFLSYSQLAGGKYVILEGDALSGFASSMRSFCDNLLNGKSFFYSWSISMGVNGFLTLPSISITIPLFLILNKLDISIVVIINLALKAGLASLFFYTYMDKTWKISGVKSLIFSVFYALCAYQISFMPFLITHEDAIFMLPLILYVCSEFADKGRYKILFPTYLYLFVSYFYMAYIVGFFSLLYLILYLFFINRYDIKTIFKKLVFFGVCIIITAGISMAVLFPTAQHLFTSYAEDATTIDSTPAANLFDYYNQLFIGQNSKILNIYPYIYCGLATLLLVPFYFVNKKISLNEKKLDILLLAIMIISGFITPVYLFWHCFDAPDNFFYRYSFIISFLLCVIACKESVYISEIKKKSIWGVILLNIIFYLLYMILPRLLNLDAEDINQNNIMFLIVNASFLIIYGVWIIAFSKHGDKEKKQKGLGCLILFITIVESVVNGCSAYYKSDWYNPSNNYDTYKLWISSTERTLGKIYEDGGEGFFRINFYNDYDYNGPLFFNYKGITYFSNLENYKVRKCMENLGIDTSPRVAVSYGLTDFTNMIFDVKYNVMSLDYGTHNEYVVDFNQNPTIIKNENCLALGFLVEDDICEFTFPGRNQFVNINSFASCITGEKVDLYEAYNGDVEYNGYGVNIVRKDDGNVFLELGENETDDYYAGTFFWSIPIDDRDAFVQMDYGSAIIDRSAPFIIDGKENKLNSYERLGASYIKQLSRFEDGFSFGICMSSSLLSPVLYPPKMYFAYYNYDNFIKVYDALKDGQMEIVNYKNDYIDAHIDVEEDGKVLFTSIPYDEGWEIKVNGVKTEPLQLLDGAFIGLDLPVGTYDLEFRYHVPGFKTGYIISFISIMMMLSVFFVNPKVKTVIRPIKTKKEAQKENENNNPSIE